MKKINSLTKRFLAVVFAVLMFVSAANVPAYAEEVNKSVRGDGNFISSIFLTYKIHSNNVKFHQNKK